MTATPWWLGEGEAPEPGPDGPSSTRPPGGVDPAAVQEAVAGGLALVSSFLRLVAPAAEPTTAPQPEPEAPPERVEVLVDVEVPDDAPPAGDPEEQAAPPAHEHLGGECRSCPVCQGLALLREVRPELVDGLGDALDALAATVRGFRTDPGRGSPWA